MPEQRRPLAIRVGGRIIEALAALQVLQWAVQLLAGLGLAIPTVPTILGVAIVLLGAGFLAWDILRHLENRKSIASREPAQGRTGNNLAITMRNGPEGLADVRAAIKTPSVSPSDDKRWSEATIHRFLDVMERKESPQNDGSSNDPRSAERQKRLWMHFLRKMKSLLEEYPRFLSEVESIRSACLKLASSGKGMMLASAGLMLGVTRPYEKLLTEWPKDSEQLSRQGFLYCHLLYRNAVTGLMELHLLAIMFLEQEAKEAFAEERKRMKELEPSMRKFTDEFKQLEDDIAAKVEVLDLMGS